jgi:MFS family permease
MNEPGTAAAAGTARLDPRYLVVFGACATQFTVIGLLYAYGVLFASFEAEFGWSRTLLSGCVSLAFLVMGLLAMPAGRLNDRLGPRAVLTVTGTSFGIGIALIALVSEPWHLYAIFALFIGLGLSTHDVVTLGTVARWFERRRGIMTGLVKTGTAAGQTVIPPLMALMVAWVGWRSAVTALGLAAIVLLLLAAVSMSAPPKRARPAGEDLGEDLGEGPDYAAVRRTRIFWTMCAIQFLFFPALTTVPLHIVVHGMDLGMTAALAAGLLSMQGASSVAGRLTVGTLTDRIRGKYAYAICFTALIMGLSALLVIETPWLLFVVVAVYGFGHGGFFTVVAPTIAEYFGTRAHGAAFGSVIFFGTIGGAIGPILAGRAFDVTGSYTIAFATLLAMAVLGLVLALSLPKTARF